MPENTNEPDAVRNTEETVSTQTEDHSTAKEQPFEPLFPSEWGWQRYEPAFKELMKRVVYAHEAGKPHGDMLDTGNNKHLLDYESKKAKRWYVEKIYDGQLPLELPDVERQGDRQLDRIYDSNLATAKLMLRGDRMAPVSSDQRADLSNAYNPPPDELAPKNDNEPAPQVQLSKNDEEPNRVFICEHNEFDLNKER